MSLGLSVLLCVPVGCVCVCVCVRAGVHMPPRVFAWLCFSVWPRGPPAPKPCSLPLPQLVNITCQNIFFFFLSFFVFFFFKFKNPQ